ncbi:MAG: protoporphyrinogen oxidase [Magnetococcus sp. WYHC-3]
MNTPFPAMVDLCVVGAGLSGLSTAWFAQQRGFSLRVIESRPQVGGTILTERLPGHRLVERGPNSTLQKPGDADDALGRLITALGLEGELLEAAPAARYRFVLRHGRLCALPTSPPGFVSSPLFSPAAKLRLLLEPFIGRAAREESVAEFVRRRLGQEFLDYAIEPFISGVYAGDPRQLSVRAAVARIHALEVRHGSLIRGALAQGKAHRQSGLPRGRMISFRQGMDTLPRRIAAALPEHCIVLHRAAARLEREDGGWRVLDGEGEILARGRFLVLAVPAPVAAGLLRDLAPAAAQALEEIPYAPIHSAGLGFRRDHVTHALDGFGFLVPRREGVRLLGGLFSSTLFPGRAPEGEVLITAFLGGTQDPQAVTLDDGAVLAAMLRDLDRCLGLSGSPEFTLLTRYTRAIPQYTLGHQQRVATVDAAVAGLPGLLTRCNWRDGISVADCVRAAEKTAADLVVRRGG